MTKPSARNLITPIDHSHLVKVPEWTSPSGRKLSVEGSTEFSVSSAKGRFRFLGFVQNADTGAEWVDAFGPVGGASPRYRSFAIESIKAVHVKKVARPAGGES
jgi:hypothetical protein